MTSLRAHLDMGLLFYQMHGLAEKLGIYDMYDGVYFSPGAEVWWWRAEPDEQRRYLCGKVIEVDPGRKSHLVRFEDQDRWLTYRELITDWFIAVDNKERGTYVKWSELYCLPD